MVKKEVYEELRQRYGKVSSWAIWDGPYDSSKEGVDNLKIFKNKNILEELNTDYVFIALNASDANESVKEGQTNKLDDWFNFHSDDKKTQQDYKIRYALHGTKYWGSYMTDLFKDKPQKYSKKLLDDVNKNNTITNDALNELKQELSIVERNGKKPILVAIGRDVYKLLKPLYSEYKVVRVTHYSNYVGPKLLKGGWPAEIEL